MHEQAAAVERHFFEALELGPAERAELLARLSGDSQELARRVQSLLAAHERAAGYLEQPPPEVDGQELIATLESLVHQTQAARSGPADFASGGLPAMAAAVLDPPRRPGDAGTLGPYDVVNLISIGGMGMVFLAHDARLERPVAIKAMQPLLAADAMCRQRFLREARAIAALKHDHIVAIHEVEGEAPVPYLVMEYVPGGSLCEWLKSAPTAGESPLPAAEIARIGSEVAQALAAAHAAGLVPRDVKPANILIERPRGRVKLGDFGLAHAVEGTHLTAAGLVALTPHYASPEQVLGRPVDRRSDLFSLGSVLYALAARRPPFDAEMSIAILRRVADDPPPDLAAIRPDLPAPLIAVIEALLQKDPAHRPVSAAEVADVLGRLARDPHAQVKPWRCEPGRRFSRTAFALLAAIALPLVLGGGWWAWLGSGRALAPPDSDAPAAVTPQISPPPTVESVPPPAVEPPAPRSIAELFDESGTLRGEGQLVSLLVARDGTAMYAAGNIETIFAWSTRSEPPARRFAALGDKVAEMALSPDGSRLAAVARGRMLCVYDTADGTILTKLPSIVPLRQLAFSHDGSRLLVTPWLTPAVEQMMPTTVGVHVDPRAIGVYDAQTLQHVQYLRPKQPQAFYTLDCDPAGKYIAAGTQSGAVLLFDAASGEQIGEFGGQIGPNFNIRFSAGGQHLWSTGNENSLVCRTVPGGEQVYRRLIARPITRIAVSSDESWIALGGGVLDVRVIDLTGQVGEQGVVSFSGHTSSIFGVAFLPGDRELISCGWDSTVRLWRLPQRPRTASPP